MNLLRKLACVVAALSFGLFGLAGPAGATYPGENGKILVGGLASTPTIDFHVYRAFTPDGLVEMEETGDYSPQFAPEWSPNGEMFAAVCAIDLGGNLCTFEPDGTLIEVLLPDEFEGEISAPTWQPNGKHIAFSSNGDGSFYSLYKVSADGLETLVPLTGSDEHQEFSPEWSPTGEWIAYTSVPENTASAIYRVSPDGSDVDRLTGQVQAFGPSWSPDGKWIAYNGQPVNGESHDLFKMRADGTGKQRLIKASAAGESNPVWSPNGKWIVYTRFTETNTKLVKHNLVTGVRKSNTWPDEVDLAGQATWQAKT